MNSLNIPKILFYTVTIVCVLGLTFALGLYSGAKKTAVYKAVRNLKSIVERNVDIVTEEAGTLTGMHPTHFLQPARYAGWGVTVNDVAEDDDNLVFLTGFFGEMNELRLIQRNGEVVARWPVRFSEIFPDTSHIRRPPETDWNVDIHGALALPDGSIVFNFENSGLVKLDRCGSVVWTLARTTHHSVERAEDGGFWVPGFRYYPKGTDSPFPPFTTPFREDTLLRISDDGRVVDEISVPKIFYDNELEALLTSTGHAFHSKFAWDKEIVHLNKIDELPREIADDFPLFEAGDLMLSIRGLNLLMVVDPDLRKVKWWRIGPWLRQHDPEFKKGGTITVFNNNIYMAVFESDLDKSLPSLPRVSNIIEIDPVTDAYTRIYGGSTGNEFLSVIRGKHEITENGGLLITEFEGGRIVETDAEGRVIWEYINRYNEEEVAEMTEARIYPRSYFTVSNWSCGRVFE